MHGAAGGAFGEIVEGGDGDQAIGGFIDRDLDLDGVGAEHRLGLRPDSLGQKMDEGLVGVGVRVAGPHPLIELVEIALAGARRIAVPGCFPTTVTLALLPALVAGLVDGRDVVVVAPTGPSGAGKSLKVNLLAAELLGNASAYGVGGVHRHVPEMLQNFRRLGAAAPTISFTPVLVPMARGILATVTAPLAAGTDPAAVREAYATALADEPFVHLLPEGVWPQTQAVLGSNAVNVQVAVDEAAGRLVAVAALDNLTKGTAGGAVQSMNLALGLPEETGLTTIGVAP